MQQKAALGGGLRNFFPRDPTNPKRLCRAFKIWPSLATDMAPLLRLVTFSKTLISFLINDSHAGMPKNQSCRFFKKPFRAVGDFGHLADARFYPGATKKGETMGFGASASSALRNSAFATDRASADVNSNAR